MSWVCRKLTLAEGLSDELTGQVRLGLVCARAAALLGEAVLACALSLHDVLSTYDELAKRSTRMDSDDCSCGSCAHADDSADIPF